MGYKRSLLIIYIILTMPTLAQDIDSLNIAELKNTYDNLEYNTLAYNDLKETWDITDPLLLIKLFNRFVVSNAIYLNDEEISKVELTQKLNEIFNNDVIAQIRKRFYDNEIDFFAFIRKSSVNQNNPNYLLDPVTDGFYLRKILGSQLYEKIKERDYYSIDLTKDLNASKYGYCYDIYLDLFDPHLMFWSTTSKRNNKYLVSLWGKWGQNYIFLPGWYFNDYVVGLNICYLDNLLNNQEYNFNVSFGTGFQASRPIAKPTSSQGILRSSGNSLFGKFAGQPFKNLIKNWKHFFLDIEGQFTFNQLDASNYNLSEGSVFSSVRNYWVAKIEQKEIFDGTNFGHINISVGISAYDSYKYQISSIDQQPIEIKYNDGHGLFQHFGFCELGIENQGNLLQYSISCLWGSDIEYKYNYFGFETRIMLSNTLGFDFKTMFSPDVNLKNMPYREQSYVVFSPIIRINY